MKKTLTLALLFYASVVAFCGCKTNHTVQTPNYPITTLKSTIYKGVNGDYITLQQTKTELWLNGSPYISKPYRDWETDRKSTRLNSSHSGESRMPSSA